MDTALPAYKDSSIARILEGGVRVDQPPSILWVELTNKCNFACVMCPNAFDSKKSFGFMSMGMFRSIVEQAAPFDPFFAMFLGGESMLHPRLFDMVRAGKDAGLTRMHLVTNASMLDQRRGRELLDCGLDMLTFSFDGYNRETFEATRVGGDFNQVVANIRGFLRLKKQAGLDKPRTKMYALDLHGEGDEPFARFFETFREDGLNEYGIEQPGHWAGLFKDTTNFQAFRNGPNFFPCHYLWKSLSVLWNGVVAPCCADFEGKLPIGDLSREGLLDVWNGPAITALRGDHLARDVGGYSLCRDCDVVWRHEIDPHGVPLSLVNPARPAVTLNPPTPE